MSTVAWDGKTLAADRQATCGGLKQLTSKIAQMPDGTILASTGNISAGRILMEWYQNGAVFSDYPVATQKEDNLFARLIVVKDRKVFTYETLCYGIPMVDPFFAWGSGRDFAIGAMAKGANAAEAIIVASRFDSDTGMGVEAFEVH